MSNPLLHDRHVDFLLHEVLDAEALCHLPAFSDHSRETFDLYLGSCRKLAREVLLPTYRPMDDHPPELVDGRVRVHPRMGGLWSRMVELGVINATRPEEVGGQRLPLTIATLATGYLMAGNLSAYGYPGLTTGAARLIESFGTDDMRERFMRPMYEGRWSGTMALTEPDAGSSLADVQTRARPTEHGHYLIEGNKIFISGGDQDFTENIVHLTLARIEGAPAGVKGLSLFAIPKWRPEGDELVPNDCTTAGLLHKIGWRGLPSIALNFGEEGDCRGWLVGEPHRGIRHMFQMMNEARLMVGMNGVATAAVAYHEALAYALDRPQGRPVTAKDPASSPVPIIEHADVRRMLLRQKAIVYGGLSLLATCARHADVAEHGADEAQRQRAGLLLDLLIPVAKSFPAEWGFEANVLAVQVHGGYGYTSEYLPEAWMRDQKLNSIHEGTTGIQSLDLLGRKAMLGGGAALGALAEEVLADIEAARRVDVPAAWCDALAQAIRDVGALTAELGQRGASGDVEGMLLHSVDYLQLFSIVAVAWQWLRQATAAQRGLGAMDDPSRGDSPFYRGILRTAQYWLSTELPRVAPLIELCRSAEDSYAQMRPDMF
jgi:alkylation response protein AidB-like acyl-CoA dehydrogenase